MNLEDAAGNTYDEHQKPEPSREKRDDLAEPGDVDEVPNVVHETLVSQVLPRISQVASSVVLGARADKEEAQSSDVEHRKDDDASPSSRSGLEEPQTKQVERLVHRESSSQRC